MKQDANNDRLARPFLAEIRKRLRWLKKHPDVARFDGKAISKADAMGYLEEAAFVLTSDHCARSMRKSQRGKADAAPVDYDYVEDYLRIALEYMAQALHNEGRVRSSGRPRRTRKEDAKWHNKVYLLWLENPELGPYELARKVTGRARGDPLVVRLARWEAERRRKLWEHLERKRRRKVRDFKVADKIGKPV